jgi:hypothetical protein
MTVGPIKSKLIMAGGLDCILDTLKTIEIRRDNPSIREDPYFDEPLDPFTGFSE